MSGWKSTKDGKHFKTRTKPGINSNGNHSSHSGTQPSSLHQGGTASSSMLHSAHDVLSILEPESKIVAKQTASMLDDVVKSATNLMYYVDRSPHLDTEQVKNILDESGLRGTLENVIAFAHSSINASIVVLHSKNIHESEEQTISAMNYARHVVDAMEKADKIIQSHRYHWLDDKSKSILDSAKDAEMKSVESHDIARKLREADNILKGIPKSRMR